MMNWKAFLHWSAVVPFLLWPLVCAAIRLHPTFAFLSGMLLGSLWAFWRRKKALE